MKYKILAICDPEKEYVSRFADYIREHGNIPMDIHIFTGLSELTDFMKSQPIEILLLSEELLRDDMAEWPAGVIIILQQDHEMRNTGRYPSVYKYRSARDIVREVMALYGEKKNPAASDERVLKPVCKVIGVYSPVARCYKTTFALALGQILAADKAVIYLNLEEFSGLGQMLHEAFVHNISDLLYMMRQGESDLMSRMTAITQHLSALDYIPPCVSGQELRGVSPEEWHELLREMIARSSYEVIILDVGSGLGHLEDLLTECDLIYMPVLPGGSSNAKMAAFDTFLKMSGAERIAGRIRHLQMNIVNMPDNRDRYLQQIVWSDVGDYARECIRRDGL